MMSTGAYYIPHKATWPIAATAGLMTSLAGFANYLNGNAAGSTFMVLGLTIFILMLAGWFTLQANESESGMYSHHVGISYRMGMMWFIFSEIMFFAVFFGTLWFTRNISLDWLAGIGDGPGRSSAMLWPNFDYVWPTNGPGNIGGEFEPMGAFGLPLLNTLILLTSGVTCTWAHHGLLAKNRPQLIKGLTATVCLGFLFVAFQALEYQEAYHDMGLTLGSGIYGSTFFMLTGFHGAHVCIGAIMLTVVLFRSWRGHFTPENHFVFEAAAWYWHFVDVVWLGLFVFVYLL
ncbi:MAG: cytochrome c oxidase subunit 3 [Gammaproteobacteria bacterium]|jgi:cytochrome c oxidase subunit III|nr:cytochrome c oxidase subunit 3 [Gammaproteobacteria bacterium]MBT5223524.1 cytochrome c oxidase subunit 3 [Gammaproteobacteria bacterium]MBT5826632.1 cytochrome c oxidase subunit 3 [Gammaproteobacteria bacterium]MBT5965920.1 cytochrome c oxidase subunit 3 [Gammaproteobacteria bacterium]MBT6419795.1 cytochrome c oxidase subunit 3 [Gammaproteobacteria bacterium]